MKAGRVPLRSGSTGESERAHALSFLRSSCGDPQADVDAAMLDDVFLALASGKHFQAKVPSWIDDLIQTLRPPSVSPPTLRLCLTHDVDFTTSRDQGRKFLRRLQRAMFADGPRQRAAIMAMGSLVRLLAQPWQGERYGDYMDWLRLEDRFGYRSTFFFLPFPDAHAHVVDGDYRFTDRVWFDRRRIRVSDMIREIADAGWEVGLHGTYNSAIRPGLLRRQKDELERILKREVCSVRQHFLNRRPGVTHRLQADAGFEVDSTIGHTRSVGLKVGTSHPYQIWDEVSHQPLELVEVPLTAMDTPLLLAGLDATRTAAATEILRQTARGIMASGGVFCVNWHPHNLTHPGLQEIYAGILAWSRDHEATAVRMDAFRRRGTGRLQGKPQP